MATPRRKDIRKAITEMGLLRLSVKSRVKSARAIMKAAAPKKYAAWVAAKSAYEGKEYYQKTIGQEGAAILTVSHDAMEAFEKVVDSAEGKISMAYQSAKDKLKKAAPEAWAAYQETLQS